MIKWCDFKVDLATGKSDGQCESDPGHIALAVQFFISTAA